VTVNTSYAESPSLPVTVTRYIPPAALETTNELAIGLPSGPIWQTYDRIKPFGVEDIVQVPTSPVLNAVPFEATLTTIPGEPDGEPSVIPGSLVATVKVLLAKSPVEPVSVSLYVAPGVADDATVKEPIAILNVPDADSVGLFVPVNNAPPPEGGVKISVAGEVSELLKPLPDTATLIPCGPLVGETVREGTLVIVNCAGALPFTATFIVYG
jgi:hypothetical protein